MPTCASELPPLSGILPSSLHGERVVFEQVIWLLLHLDHLGQFLAIFAETAFAPRNFTCNGISGAGKVWLDTIFIFAYFAWNTLRWSIVGVPCAYTLLFTVMEKRMSNGGCAFLQFGQATQCRSCGGRTATLAKLTSPLPRCV